MKQLKPILLGILAACFFSHAQYNKVLAASNFGGVSTIYITLPLPTTV